MYWKNGKRKLGLDFPKLSYVVLDLELLWGLPPAANNGHPQWLDALYLRQDVRIETELNECVGFR
jgi:hypothetical protein